MYARYQPTRHLHSIVGGAGEQRLQPTEKLGKRKRETKPVPALQAPIETPVYARYVPARPAASSNIASDDSMRQTSTFRTDDRQPHPRAAPEVKPLERPKPRGDGNGRSARSQPRKRAIPSTQYVIDSEPSQGSVGRQESVITQAENGAVVANGIETQVQMLPNSISHHAIVQPHHRSDVIHGRHHDKIKASHRKRASKHSADSLGENSGHAHEPTIPKEAASPTLNIEGPPSLGATQTSSLAPKLRHAESPPANEEDAPRDVQIHHSRDKSTEAKLEHNDHNRSKSHSAVMSRYEASARSRQNRDKIEDARFDIVTQLPQVNGNDPTELRITLKIADKTALVPIRLPSPEAGMDVAPYNTFPTWLSSPAIVGSDARRTFEEVGLDTQTAAALRRKGFKIALPIQTGILPLLLPTPLQHPGDVCVSAATGSGKTLSYVLPIIQDLKTSPGLKLRALIVVPTRELVTQVKHVCDTCAEGTDLQIGVSVGNQPLNEEQEGLLLPRLGHQLMGHENPGIELPSAIGSVRSNESGIAEPGQDSGLDHELPTPIDQVPSMSSNVDILIATPGRLVEHVHWSSGFSLKDLQWLVVDEADRLLDQRFQDWVDVVDGATGNGDIGNSPMRFGRDVLLAGIFAPQKRTPVRKVILSATMTSNMNKLSALSLRNPKLVLLESTVSSEQQGDAGHSISMKAMLSIPSTLEENAVPVGDGAEKPLYLISLLTKLQNPDARGSICKQSGVSGLNLGGNQLFQRITNTDHAADSDASSSDTSSYVSSGTTSTSDSTKHRLPGQSPMLLPNASEEDFAIDRRALTPSPSNAAVSSKSAGVSILIFTSSNEATIRLQRLLTFIAPDLAASVATLTKITTSSKTARILHRLRTGRLRILIASDRASRGLDFPTLTDVISYDVPRSVTDYVHRVGRTARAGGKGRAWTLLQGNEAGWFWHVIARDHDREDVSNVKGGKGDPDASIRRGKGQRVRKMRLEGVGENGMRSRYVAALEKLKTDIYR